jgi:RAB protein geranylgeranyltransferase component A
MGLDIYIAVVSSAHSVCPKGYYIAIVSTIAETTANHHLELAPGFERLGKIEEKFMVSSSTCVSLADQLTFSGSPNSIVRAS